MPDTARTAYEQLPPEYRLPVVVKTTVDQLTTSRTDFESSLQEFTDTNPELITWLRVDANRRFPNDLAERKKAIGMTLVALRLLQNQKIIDVLTDHFALDAVPSLAVLPEVSDTILPPAA